MVKRIIPCLDLQDEKVVTGVGFANLKDVGSPAGLAYFYDQAGADELVILDIASSGNKTKKFADLIRKIKEQVSVPLVAGGGISSLGQVETLLEAGADRVSLNSSAVANPELLTMIAERYKSSSLVVAIDADYNKNTASWEVFTQGGRMATGKEVCGWAKEVESRGAGEILLTSINRDGGQDGYNLELTAAVAGAVKIPVIASGGAGSLEHFRQVLTKGKAGAALAASLFHNKIITVGEVKKYLAQSGIKVRD